MLGGRWTGRAGRAEEGRWDKGRHYCSGGHSLHQPDWPVCVCVSFPCPHPQALSQLDLTVQMSKQNGTRAREVLLVLDLNKTVYLQLQAPGIPLQLAYVSDPY